MTDNECKNNIVSFDEIRKKQKKAKSPESIPANAFSNFYYGENDDIVPITLKELVSKLIEEPTILKIGGEIFSKNDKILKPIEDTKALLTWLHHIEKIPYFNNSKGLVKEDFLFLAYMKHVADDFEAISKVPLYPMLPTVYLDCDYVEPEATGALDELLTFFNPNTEYDAALLKSAFATVAWSGGHGKKPFFLFTADQVNTGKSTLLEKIAEFYLGGISLSPSMDHSNRCKEILKLQHNRVVYFDNVKIPSWSDPGLEAQITSPIIQAHKLYQGAVQIPNCYTYMATLNDPNVSEDLASRSVAIKLNQPKIFVDDWMAKIEQFLADNRSRLFADIGALIMAPKSNDYAGASTRFPLWDKTILQKNKVSCIELTQYIKDSQNSMNSVNNDETEDNLIYDLQTSVIFSGIDKVEKIVTVGGPEDYSWWIPTELLYELTTKNRTVFNKKSGANGRMIKKRLDKFKKWDVVEFRPYDGNVKLGRGYFFLSKSNPTDQAYRLLPGSDAKNMNCKGLLISNAVWELIPSRPGDV